MNFGGVYVGSGILLYQEFVALITTSGAGITPPITVVSTHATIIVLGFVVMVEGQRNDGEMMLFDKYVEEENDGLI